jgi:predicted amidohydrolase YtcJ
MATKRCDWFMSLDGRVGSLAVGRLADLIVLSDDYFKVPVDDIRTLTSMLTMVGGRVVYGAGPYEKLEQ